MGQAASRPRNRMTGMPGLVRVSIRPQSSLSRLRKLSRSRLICTLPGPARRFWVSRRSIRSLHGVRQALRGRIRPRTFWRQSSVAISCASSVWVAMAAGMSLSPTGT